MSNLKPPGMSSFSDPKAIADYAENASRRVPGLNDMHRMSALLLAECTPPDGRVLVVGAGGGMELKCFAQTHPGWRFDGVDPSAEMLSLAKTALGPLASRVQLHHGHVEAAPAGPFDAAACLLTLHFTTEAERYRTLCEIHARLKPGGVLVAMHYSTSRNDAERALWLSRCAAFAISSGVDPEQARAAAVAIGKQLPILAPDQDEELMRRAGFSGIEVFYEGLAFRGWLAYA
jgi:tRNA (cmo5U34)-methyltransferase